VSINRTTISILQGPCEENLNNGRKEGNTEELFYRTTFRKVKEWSHKVKIILAMFMGSLFSISVSANQCATIFAPTPSPAVRTQVNALKRINNYSYFSKYILQDLKNKKTNVVIFDIPKDGVIENRPSLEDFVSEVEDFAQDMRFVYNDYTKDQVLISRLGANPVGRWEKNLLFGKEINQRSIVENLGHSEDLQQRFEDEVFHSVLSWLSRPGKRLNVVILPSEVRESFEADVAKDPHLQIHTIPEIIQKLEP
jgi:hypothetical protein